MAKLTVTVDANEMTGTVTKWSTMSQVAFEMATSAARYDGVAACRRFGGVSSKLATAKQF
jgi:hypothetical protein